MNKLLNIFLPLLIIIGFLFAVVPQKEIYFQQYDSAYWQQRYEESGWAKGWEAENQIGDPELYAYAGWRQIQGDDPTKINPEVPPLGRYFLGLSILLFKNQFFSSLFFGALLVFLTYLVSSEVLGPSWWRFLPSLFLSWDGLFRENLPTSMLDLPFAVFITLSFYLLIRGRKNPRFYVFLPAALGAVAATKMHLAGFTLTGIIFGYLLILFLFFRYKDIFWFLFSLPLFGLVYLGSYSVYFFQGHNLLDFKYLHFWIRHFARVQVESYPNFEIWRILLLGKWKTWWEGSGIITVSVWNPFWAAGSLLSPVVGVLGLAKQNFNLVILCLWILTFLAMFSFGVPYPRYLLPILPAIYIILVLSFKKIVELKLWPNIKH